MSRTSRSTSVPLAVGSRVEGDRLIVRLDDGREITIDPARHPRLRVATPVQLANCRLIGRGAGLHWAEFDEDLSIVGLLRDGG